MKILAIRLARLGDVILLLPALTSLKSRFPEARLSFLTDQRYAPAAELCPALDEVIGLDRITMRDGSLLRAVGAMARLVRDVRGRKYDLLVDFHSFRETNLLSWLSGARRRLAIKRYNAAYLSFCFNLPPVPEDKDLHVSEMFLRVVEQLGGASTPTRTLIVPTEMQRWAERSVPPRPRIALYVDAPAPERVWPPENFAALADYAAGALGASVLVLSGPGGRSLAERVRQASRHSERLRLFTDVTIPELASLIASADLLVSNDTGPMHIGPAVGVPTLGLFSVGFPEHFRPAGPNDRFLRGNPIDRIDVRMAIAAAKEMWVSGVLSRES
jgi:ADP-heptose:LPS heptosyltransferase